MSDIDDDDIKTLMYTAFERAFQEQLGQLYKVYLTNVHSVSQQAENTKRGINLAVEAYRLAVSAVDSWGSGDD
jgi:hypothetical protein